MPGFEPGAGAGFEPGAGAGSEREVESELGSVQEVAITAKVIASRIPTTMFKGTKTFSVLE